MTQPEQTIWSGQGSFLRWAAARAKSVFSTLDAELSPRLLVIGLPCCRSDPVLVPQTGGDYSPADVRKVVDQCDDRKALRPDALDVDQVFVRDQLEDVLHERDEPLRLVSFCSLPSRVAQHWVSVVLQLDRAAFSEWPSLRKREVDGERVRTSLVDAAAATYLRTCQQALLRPAYADFLLDPPEQILRSAAEELMWTPAWVAAREPIDLFGKCNTLASLTYEGEEASGSMIVAAAEHADVERIIEFDEAIPTNHFRRVRKLLELARDDLSLVTDSADVLALGSVRPEYDPSTEEVFSIAFTGRNRWELRHAKTTLMHVVNGQPGKPTGLGDIEERLRTLFPDLPNDSAQRLRRLIEDLRQERGTTLVISAQAAEEVERLRNQCTRIKPTPMNSAVMMQRLTSIDGAIILDINGTCHAIGAILDGTASEKSNAARGARYNSALSYVESRSHPVLAIVVSEDGTVEMLPEPERRSRCAG